MEGLQEKRVDGKARLENEHAGVKVEWWRRAELRLPLHPIGALLAVANLVLGGGTPCLLTETVHHGIEMAVWGVEKMVDVFEHLYVSVQVYQLAVLHELQRLIACKCLI